MYCHQHFCSIDCTVVLNLNFHKCCRVQYGNEEPNSPRTWISETFEDFLDMQIVRHAPSICWNNDRPRWTPPSLDGTAASTKSLVERLCNLNIYAISVLNFIGSICALDKATFKAENHALQCTTAGPYNAISSELLAVDSVCGLGPDLVGMHSLSLVARYRVASCSSTLRRGLEKVNAARAQLHSSVCCLSCL